MAGESVVGALRVVLGMDTAAFEDGAKRATDKMQGFGAAFQRAFAAATVAAVFTALVRGISDTVDQMDELGKASQKIGIPVEQLSALKYAAGLADVSFESLSNSMVKFDKNISAVAGGAKGPAAEAFHAMGISLQDAGGSLKTTSDLFAEFADRIAGYRDGAAKTALVTAAFGKGAADLIPLLNQGSKGLASAADEARKFGLIVTDEAAKGAEQFNDNLKRLSSIMGGVMIQVTSGLAGELVKLFDAMVNFSKNAETMGVITGSISVAIRAVLLEIATASTFLNNMATAMIFLGQAAAAVATGNLGKIPVLLKDAKDKTAEANAAFVETSKSLLGLGPAAGEAGDGFAKLVESLEKLATAKPDAPILASKNALDHFVDSTKKAIAVQQADVDTFTAAAGAREKARFQLEALAIAQENGLTITAAQRKEIEALGNSLQLVSQRMAGLELTQEFLSPWELYAQELNKINVLLASNSISMDTYAKKSTQLALNMQLAYATAMQGIVSNVSSAFRDLAAINKNYAGIAKAAAIGEAIVNTYVGATKALATVPPPFNFAAAAAVVAAGLANVAKIVATPFATGGSFKVGGAGGIDSQLVTIAATPGEMVDVRRPGQQGGFGSEITIHGIGPRDLFTGDMLRGLFDALNQGYSDGYKIKAMG